MGWLFPLDWLLTENLKDSLDVPIWKNLIE